MSKKATKLFTLWFLFVLCIAPALVLLPLTLQSLERPRYEPVLGQVVSIKDGTVCVRYGGLVGELADPNNAADWQVGETVTVYKVHGVGIYADAGSSMPAHVPAAVFICFAFWLAAAVLFVAAVSCTARRKPRQKSARPMKEPAPPHPSFDPERKK